MWFYLLDFIIGIAFGFFHRGKEDRMGILRNGAIAGLVIGIIFVLISMFLVPGAIGLDAGFLGIFGIFIKSHLCNHLVIGSLVVTARRPLLETTSGHYQPIFSLNFLGFVSPRFPGKNPKHPRSWVLNRSGNTR
jgi:Na+/proline symporter